MIRRFEASRTVRLGDADPSGRLRLDALARYLQDVAADDANDAGLDDAFSWVVRKLVVTVTAWPRFADTVCLTTWCGGIGPRWAERLTRVETEGGALVDASTVWVLVDATGRPLALPARFHDVYGETAAGRKVSGRLTHPGPPAEAMADARPWPVRSTDLDILGHVNNAAYWEVVEEHLPLDAPLTAELEYRLPIEPHEEVAVIRHHDDLWLCSPAGAVHASARVTRTG